MTTLPPSLHSLLVALWGDQVRVPRRGGTARALPPHTYALIPAASRARLLVPLRPRRAAASAIRHYPTSKRSVRALRRLAGAVARIGLLPLLFRDHVSEGASSSGGLRQTLEGAIGKTDLAFAIAVDLQRPHRKPTLRVMSREGRVVAFAKVGWNELTRPLVEREASILTSFRDNAPRWGFATPEVLASLKRDDLHVVLVTPLGGDAGPGPPPRELPIEATSELSRGAPITRGELVRSDYWKAMVRRAESAPADTHVARALKVTESRYGDLPLQFGLVHGDWVPWNMGSGRRLSVWDWERACLSAPFGLDAIHFIFQVALHWDFFPPRKAVHVALERAESELPRIGLAPPMAVPLLSLSLLEMCLRFAEARGSGISANPAKYVQAWDELTSR